MEWGLNCEDQLRFCKQLFSPAAELIDLIGLCILRQFMPVSILLQYFFLQISSMLLDAIRTL